MMKTRIIVVALAVLMVFAMVSCKDEPVHEHVFDQEVVKDEYLAEKATEQSAAKYYKSCACGAKGEETFESGEKLDHEFGGWIVSKKATCTESGEETRKCIHEGCNATETQKIPAIGHKFDADGKCTNEGCNAKETSQARIGNVYYDTLTEAIKSLKNAESKTAEIAVYGDVKLENFSTITGSSDNSAYNITFVGSGKDKTSIDIATDSTMPPTEGNHQNYIEGANLTFKNITVKIGDNSDYQGFVRASSLGFEGCAIVGMGACWGSGEVVFNNCVFEDNGGYNLWLYSGSKFTFVGCEFNSSAGKFINAYQPGAKTSVEVIIDGCKFIGTVGKYAGIFLKPEAAWNVSIVKTSSEGVADGSISGSPLYDVRIKGGDGGATVKEETTVTIDGVVVWENGAKKSN